MKTLPFLIFLILIVGCGKDAIGSTDGTFKDSRDKHVYKYVKIGTQTWMAENLAYLPAINPSSAGSETEPHYYVYDYNFEGGSVDVAKTKSNYTTYGVLYNWVAAKTACPTGWHLSTDAEWKILEKYLGMSQTDVDSQNERESGSVGKALKSTLGWSMKDGNGDNSSGFAALPGGYRFFAGVFDHIGFIAYFWSASEVDATEACSRQMMSYNDSARRFEYKKSSGFSVRCLKNQ